MFVKDQSFRGKIIAGLPVCASESQFQRDWPPTTSYPLSLLVSCVYESSRECIITSVPRSLPWSV